MLRFTGASQEQFHKTDGVLIPIAPLGIEHVAQILAHLLALSEHDRYLRFGYTATDDHIQRYVAGLNFAGYSIAISRSLRWRIWR